ncbi:hypothetical protein OROMI_003280 [Orobanche minor]
MRMEFGDIVAQIARNQNLELAEMDLAIAIDQVDHTYSYVRPRVSATTYPPKGSQFRTLIVKSLSSTNTHAGFLTPPPPVVPLQTPIFTAP